MSYCVKVKCCRSRIKPRRRGYVHSWMMGGINAISVDKGTLGRHDMTITWFPFWNSLVSLGLEYRSKQKEVFGNVSMSSKLRERRINLSGNGILKVSGFISPLNYPAEPSSTLRSNMKYLPRPTLLGIGVVCVEGRRY